MPSADSSKYETMIRELKTLFAKHSESDKIEVFYNTKVFYTQV